MVASGWRVRRCRGIASWTAGDIWPLLGTSPGAASPHDVLYFYWGQELRIAVRSGRWKLHLPHPYQSLEAARSRWRPGQKHYVRKEIELSLFDLVADPGETTNERPQPIRRWSRTAIAFRGEARADLGDTIPSCRPGRTSGRSEALRAGAGSTTDFAIVHGAPSSQEAEERATWSCACEIDLELGNGAVPRTSELACSGATAVAIMLPLLPPEDPGRTG